MGRLADGENSVNSLLVRPIQGSDRDWVTSFVKSHWGSEIVVAKGRVLRPAELEGFAAFKGKHSLGLLTYMIEIALYPNALEASRKLKPEISSKGANGIPIRDELKLELELSG